MSRSYIIFPHIKKPTTIEGSQFPQKRNISSKIWSRVIHVLVETTWILCGNLYSRALIKMKTGYLLRNMLQEAQVFSFNYVMNIF